MTNVQKRVTSPMTLALPWLVALAGALPATSLATATPAAAASNPGGASAPGASTGGRSPSAPRAPARRGRSTTSVTISDARCTPAGSCNSSPHQVSIHGRLLMVGHGLAVNMVVLFPHARAARAADRMPTSRLHRSSSGLVVTVPANAHSGRIVLLLSRGRRSNPFGPIFVFRRALHPPHKPPAPAPAPTTPAPASGSPSGTAFDGQGIWIWYVNKSDGGSVPAIIQRAHAAGVGTLFVKSSDGSSNYWSQFSSSLVQQLHAAGLKVCGWQYVYGTQPAGEANLGAQAVKAGADCLVIDAEAEYEGRYASAQTYITTLRSQVGPDFPIGLASFPYVDYHPALPFSVFLGPGGAQFNVPQMYWQDIGTSVDTVYTHTYLHNRIYGRPIFPLGQTYSNPSTADLVRFRTLAPAYGAGGLSWWDYQETSTSGWSALADPLAQLVGFQPTTAEVSLGTGDQGDEVLWLQEHLAAAYPAQLTTGKFGSQTQANLIAFQTAHGLTATGRTDAATWQALLALTPVSVDWTGGAPTGSSARARARAAVRTAGTRRVQSAPESAKLPALRYEIPPHGGAGHP